MSKSSKSLGPLVECTEPNEDEEAQQSGSKTIPEPVLEEKPKQRATPSRSSEGMFKSKKRGSRLSLTSIFSFTSPNGIGKERSRSGWSNNDDTTATTLGMASESTTDLSSNLASFKRNRSSDAGSAADSTLEFVYYETDDDDDTSKKGKAEVKLLECPVCITKLPSSQFPKLRNCLHRSCFACIYRYIELSINENRVEVPCTECTNFIHPMDIRKIVGSDSDLLMKYEQFSIRRYLLGDPDVRWCPAPDCEYAVIATGCAACPELRCQKEECGMLFCYHCKREWHANQTCDQARRGEKRKSRVVVIEEIMRTGNFISNHDNSLKPGDVKSCPRCRTLIVKMDDGSCNHMICTMCSAEFCWLCLKEISDLHYLSPTGCTFWGKKPWTRKKKLLWQLGTLVGAPVGIALIASLSIPGIIFGVPVFVGKKVHQRFKYYPKLKRRLLTITCVLGSFLVSPVLAIMAIGVGVPIMLAYVYGVVPLSLCRNGGCGFSRAGNGIALDEYDEEQIYGTQRNNRVETAQLIASHQKESTIGDVVSLEPTMSEHSELSTALNDGKHQTLRLHVSSDTTKRRPSLDSAVNSIGEKVNYEEASVKAMAGSRYHDDKSVHTVYSGTEVMSYHDEDASTKALSGSVQETKSLNGSVRYTPKPEKLDEHDTYTTATINETEKDDEQPSSSSGPTASSSNPNLWRNRRIPHQQCPPGQYFIYRGDDGEEVMLLADGKLDQQSCSSKSTSRRASHQAAHCSASQLPPDIDVDPFKIRALLDNMKQMVSSEYQLEMAYEPSPTRSSRVRSGCSGTREMVVLSTGNLSPIHSSHQSMPTATVRESLDNVSLTSATSKRQKRLGMFSSWFTKSK